MQYDHDGCYDDHLPKYEGGDLVELVKPDGYHLSGKIINWLEPEENWEGCYSIDFTCSDNTIENLWLTPKEITRYTS